MRTAKEQKEDLMLAFDTIVYRTETNDFSHGPTFYGADEEGVSTLFQKEPFNFDRSLILTGSSDKIGSVTSYGANKITAFDINPLTEYLWYLKEAFYISGQSREDFLNYFIFDEKENASFSERYYDKLVKHLNSEYEPFWSALYDFYGDFAIGRYLNSFGALHPNVNSIDESRKRKALLKDALPFMEKDRYQLLQKRLRNHEVEITLHTCSLEELPKNIKGETFTFGQLSTVPYFLKTNFDYKHFLEQNFLPQLEDGGKMVLAHLYSYTIDDYLNTKGLYEALEPSKQQVVLKEPSQKAFEILTDSYLTQSPSLYQLNFFTSQKGIENFRIMKNLEELHPQPVSLPCTFYDPGICPHDTALIYTKKK